MIKKSLHINSSTSIIIVIRITMKTFLTAAECDETPARVVLLAAFFVF